MRDMVVDLRRLARHPAPATVGTRRRLWWAAAAIIVAVGAAGLWRISLMPQGLHIRSIAVLPLRNISGDPGQDYFADGLTDALTTGLAQMSALNVISRTSVMRYKGTQKTAPEIARELHVDGLVEGSVRRSGGHVSIAVQLIEGSNDHSLWAKNYERGEQDAVALQNEVAQAIAAEIRVKLTSQEQARLSTPHPVNPEAQEAYLRGLYWGDKGDPKRFHEYMQQAVHQDPRYALAYAGLGNSYGVLTSAGQIPADEAFPKWREAVTNALSLDDNLAEAHFSYAVLLFFHDYNWRDSEREYRRALQLNPNLVDAHSWFAADLASEGRVEEAVAEARRGLQLNPNSVTANLRLGQELISAKQYDEAVDQGQKMLEQEPAQAHWILGLAFEQKGNLDRAISEYQEAVKLAGPIPDLRAWLPGDMAHAYAVSGRKQEAFRLLAELKELSRLIRVDPAEFALVYAGLGEKDQAFEWLNKGYNDRPSMIAQRVKVEPRLEPLHSDPRFQAFLHKMGLPE
jgi:TolB-like protein/Flp pilus assembly protein TadD